MSELKKMREALAKIAQLANEALDNKSSQDKQPVTEQSAGNGSPETPGCSIKSLPERLQKKSAETAVKINPVNAPVVGNISDMFESVLDPQSIALYTGKYWGPSKRVLTVSFMEPTPADLRNRIISHLNAWNLSGGISFAPAANIGQVRISRGAGGYWSYLGTDILLIPSNRPTMNLQNFSMSTPESEYRRVVRHEAGHTLGFPHEHMRKELVARIDPNKAYTYFWSCCGWNKAMVDAQVLTPLDSKSIYATAPDQTSIMCYQLPGSITKDGQPILGGMDINATDHAFNALIYPKIGFSMPAEKPAAQVKENEDGWSEEEDVMDKQIEQLARETLILDNGTEQVV